MPEMMPSNLNQAEIDRFVQGAWAALQKGDLAGAHAVARQGREAGLEHAFLLKVEALYLHDQGDYQEALKSFHHARTLTPQDVSILNGIAASLAGMGEYEAALKVIDECRQLDPKASSVHYLRGWILEKALEYPSAKEAYEETVAINPKHAEAFAGLASVAAQLGDFEAARARALQALALNRALPAALLTLARADLAKGDAAAAELHLRDLLAGTRSPRQRTVALSLLGDALDAQNRPAEAFAAWNDKAAEIKKLQAPSAAVPPKAAEILPPIAARLKTMPHENWKSASGASQPARLHVFVLGFLRSGTTLVQQILACDPSTAVVDERSSLRTLALEYLGAPNGLERLAALSDEGLTEARAAYWERLRQYGIETEDRIVIDKDPLNTLNLPIIAKLFPNAKVVFCIRDPRDVVVSCFRRSIDIVGALRELMTLHGCAAYYDAVMGFGEVCRESLPLSVHQIRYEDLIEDFDRSAKELCHALGMEWREEMRNFSQSARTHAIRSTLSANQVRQPLYKESVGAWRRFTEQMTPALPILAPWVAKFGYAAE